MEYHTVQGKTKHGLIVDPGASSGVMGTGTVSAYMKEVLWPTGRDIQVQPKSGSLKHIDGEAIAGMGRRIFPIGLP
eukprot:12902130-Prorocentrum_lima.AAC.1